MFEDLMQRYAPEIIIRDYDWIEGEEGQTDHPFLEISIPKKFREEYLAQGGVKDHQRMWYDCGFGQNLRKFSLERGLEWGLNLEQCVLELEKDEDVQIQDSSCLEGHFGIMVDGSSFDFEEYFGY